MIEIYYCFAFLFLNRSECPATNSLLMNNIGKDLSTEMNNPQHRPALDYISSHLRIGKFSCNDNEEKVSVNILKFIYLFDNIFNVLFLFRAQLIKL